MQPGSRIGSQPPSNVPSVNKTQITNKDYIKSRITGFDIAVNIIKKFFKLFSRKISIFTTDVTKMQGNTYLHCNLNRNIKFYKGEIEEDQEISGNRSVSKNVPKDFELSALIKIRVGEFAKQHIEKIYSQYVGGAVVKTDIPAYTTKKDGKEIEDPKQNKEFIKIYIQMFDKYIRFKEKVENTKPITIKFGFECVNKKIVMEALDSLNKECNKDNLSRFTEETNQFINLQNTENKRIIQEDTSTKSSQQVPAQEPIKQLTDDEITAKKLEVLKANLEFVDEIKQIKDKIMTKIGELTEKEQSDELAKVQAEVKENKVTLEEAFFRAGDITKTQELGLEHVAIMNAANAEGVAGIGVTGAIYRAAAGNKDRTEIAEQIQGEFQRGLKEQESLARTNTDDSIEKTEDNYLRLRLGKALINNPKELIHRDVTKIVHVVAPMVDEEESYIKDDKDMIIACLTNSYLNAIRLAKKTDACKGLAATLIGTGVYGVKEQDSIIAFYIATQIAKEKELLSNFEVHMVIYEEIKDEAQKLIADIRAVNKKEEATI